MRNKPKIFISAVSKELHSARQLIANTLLFIGYEPVWQDILETEQGNLSWMLRRRIDECAGVIQLVGKCYGSKAPEIDNDFGSVSYTQYEALYAKKKGKKVWYFVLSDTYPVDSYQKEPDDITKLQSSYSKQIQASDNLYYPTNSPDSLEAGTLKLRSELIFLKRKFQFWAVAVSVSLLVIILVTLNLTWKQNKITDTVENTLQTSTKTLEVTEKNSSIASKTAQVTENTNKLVNQIESTIKNNASESSLDSASTRLQKAIDTMNHSDKGQVQAIELLLANGNTFPDSHFDGVLLKKAILKQSDFSSSSFIDANLTDVIFNNSILNDTNMLLATANRMDARAATANKMRLELAKIEHAIFDLASLKQSSFFFSQLAGSSFRGCDCKGVNFSYTDLTGADFSGADLTEAQFIGSVIDGAIFNDAIFNNTDMSGASSSRFDFTEKQIEGMTRTAGFQQYVGFVLMRRAKSNRYATGYEYSDGFSVDIHDIPGKISGSLPLRKGGIEAVGFSAAWLPANDGYWAAGESRITFNLDANFLNVRSRMARIKKRITDHGVWLGKKLKQLPTVSGGGREFNQWLSNLESNVSLDEVQEPLPLNDELGFILKLKSGVLKVEDVEDYIWELFAKKRYETEWIQNPNNNKEGFVDGWPIFFTKREEKPYLFPKQYIAHYRKWTLNRIKVLQNPKLYIERNIKSPNGRNGEVLKPGIVTLFRDNFHNHNRSYILTAKNDPFAEKLYPAPHRYDTYLRFPKNRNTYEFINDSNLTYPITMKIEFSFENFVIAAENKTGKSKYNTIEVRPVSVIINNKKYQLTSKVQ